MIRNIVFLFHIYGFRYIGRWQCLAIAGNVCFLNEKFEVFCPGDWIIIVRTKPRGSRTGNESAIFVVNALSRLWPDYLHDVPHRLPQNSIPIFILTFIWWKECIFAHSASWTSAQWIRSIRNGTATRHRAPSAAPSPWRNDLSLSLARLRLRPLLISNNCV